MNENIKQAINAELKEAERNIEILREFETRAENLRLALRALDGQLVIDAEAPAPKRPWNPSSEQVLAYLENRTTPERFSIIAKDLRLTDGQAGAALRKLCRDGKVTRLGGGMYRASVQNLV